MKAAAGSSAKGVDKEGTKQHKRGLVIMPGLGNSKYDYKALAELLAQEGLVVEIAGVNRVDWLRNAAGVVDINYWKGTLNPQPTVNWYSLDALQGNKHDAQLSRAPRPPCHSASSTIGCVPVKADIAVIYYVCIFTKACMQRLLHVPTEACPC